MRSYRSTTPVTQENRNGLANTGPFLPADADTTRKAFSVNWGLHRLEAPASFTRRGIL